MTVPKISSSALQLRQANFLQNAQAIAGAKGTPVRLTAQEKQFFREWIGRLRESLNKIIVPEKVGSAETYNVDGRDVSKYNVETGSMLREAKAQLAFIENNIEQPVTNNRGVNALMPCRFYDLVNSLNHHVSGADLDSVLKDTVKFKQEAEALIRKNPALMALTKDRDSGYRRKSADGTEYNYDDVRRCIWPKP